MGVKGLSTFIDENPRLIKSYELHDTKVIIDGCNIGHYLYKSDFLFGGEYAEFAERIKEFFLLLRECNIEPIVVFDGGWDKRDRVLKEKIKKQRERVNQVINSIKCKRRKYHMLAINSRTVYKDILNEIGIKYVQSDYEGDNQMAALANECQCPLISDDSDFYIYNLTHGFIKLTQINTCIKTKRGIRYSITKYLKCYIYHMNSFAQFYRLQDTRLLNLCAILAGNDLVSAKYFNHFLLSINVNPDDKIKGILSWLSKYNLNDAIDKILEAKREDKKEKSKLVILSGIDDYHLSMTNLKYLLTVTNFSTDHRLIRKTHIVAACGSKLPAHFVLSFYKGLISPSLLNIITLQRRFSQPQCDDFSIPSSYCCSRYIRQVTYGILLQHDYEKDSQHAELCHKDIDEYDRKDVVKVPFLTKLKNETSVPRLPQLYSMKKSELRNFIMDVLDAEEIFLKGIPKNLHMIAVSILFWLNNCSSKPPEELLDAIIVCILIHQENAIIIKNFLASRIARRKRNSEKSAQSHNTMCQNVVDLLRRYLRRPAFKKDEIIDCNITHCYSQLQACVQDIKYLNSLLNFPFQQAKLHEVFSGCMVYNLARDLKSATDIGELVNLLLSNNESAIKMFNLYKNKFLNCMPKSFFRNKYEENKTAN